MDYSIISIVEGLNDDLYFLNSEGQLYYLNYKKWEVNKINIKDIFNNEVKINFIYRNESLNIILLGTSDGGIMVLVN